MDGSTFTRAHRDLGQRQRALAVMMSLHRLATAAQGLGPFSCLDHQDLALHAIGCVVDGGSLNLMERGGMTRERLVQEVAARIVVQFDSFPPALTGPAPTLESIRDHARWVIDFLANRRSSPAFRQDLFNATTGRFEPYKFRLIEEREAQDGSFYLEATPVALNLYFKVDFPVHDEQIAMAAVLEYHFAAGHFDKAVEAARNYFWIGQRLSADIAALARRIRLAVRKVSFLTEVGPKLDEARACVEKALEFDRRIVDTIGAHTDRIDDAGAGEAIYLAMTAAEQCREQNQTLLLDIRRAQRLYQSEYKKRGFVHTASVNLPRLEEEVLVPAMAIDYATAAEAPVRLLQACADVQVVPVFDPLVFATLCLAPRRPRAAEPQPVRDLELVDVKGLAPRFTRALRSEAMVFVAERIRPKVALSALIEDAERSGRSDDFIEAIALCVDNLFKDQGSGTEDSTRLPGVRVDRTGTFFTHRLLQADDLLLQGQAP